MMNDKVNRKITCKQKEHCSKTQAILSANRCNTKKRNLNE
jgi:hypothetical protein